MIIEEKDYRLESISDSSPLFDLELLRVVNKGKDNERHELKNAAYGIPLDSAIKKIAHYRTCNKFPEGKATMLEYLDTFNSIIQDIKSFVEGK